ncbi:MAG: hypothetical protein ACYS21_05690, partial [Planctomycetota bacterium]
MPDTYEQKLQQLKQLQALLAQQQQQIQTLRQPEQPDLGMSVDPQTVASAQTQAYHQQFQPQGMVPPQQGTEQFPAVSTAVSPGQPQSIQQFMEEKMQPPGNFMGNLAMGVARFPVAQAALAEQIGTDPAAAAKGLGQLAVSAVEKGSYLGVPSKFQHITPSKRKEELAEEFYQYPFEYFLETTTPLLLAMGGAKLVSSAKTVHGLMKKGVPFRESVKTTMKYGESALKQWERQEKATKESVYDKYGVSEGENILRTQGYEKVRQGLEAQEAKFKPQEAPDALQRQEAAGQKATAKAQEVAPTKQPWEMTREEYLSIPHGKARMDVNRAFMAELKGKISDVEYSNIWVSPLAKGHKLKVSHAVDMGKPVPAEVLAEYPELAAKPKPKGEKGAVTPKTPKEMIELESGVSFVGDILDRPLTNDPATTLAKTGQQAVYERSGAINVQRHKSALFRKDLKKDLTGAERTDMIFVRQKTGNAFKKGDTFEAAEARLSDKAKGYLKDVDKRLEYSWRNLVDAGVYQEEAWLGDYLHQAWDISKKKANLFAGGFRLKPPKDRRLKSYAQGMIDKGYKPRFNDIADLLEYHENLMTQIMYNRQLAKQMRKWKDPESGKPLIMLASEKGVPEAYKMLDSDILARAVKPGYPVETAAGAKVWIPTRGVKVALHPDVAPAMKAVFARPYQGKLGNAIDWFNAIAKKTALSISLFHHIALTESAGGIGGVGGLLTAPVKAYKGWKMLKDPVYYKEPLSFNMQVGGTADINLPKIQRLLAGAVRKTPKPFKAAPKALQAFNNLWDATLWDYYHNGLKMYY